MYKMQKYGCSSKNDLEVSYAERNNLNIAISKLKETWSLYLYCWL